MEVILEANLSFTSKKTLVDEHKPHSVSRTCHAISVFDTNLIGCAGTFHSVYESDKVVSLISVLSTL